MKLIQSRQIGELLKGSIAQGPYGGSLRLVGFHNHPVASVKT